MTDLITLARSLLEAARQATPGPWHAEELYLIGRPEGCRPNGEVIASMDYARVLNFEEKERNAAYIALCSPDAIAGLAEGYLALHKITYEHDNLGGSKLERVRRQLKAVAHSQMKADMEWLLGCAERAEQEEARLEGALRRDRAALAEGKPEPPPKRLKREGRAPKPPRRK